MSDKKSDGYYAVGYKKPPPQHQFKPGQSGNAKGKRKRRAMSVRALIGKEMETLYTVKLATGSKKLSGQELLVKRLFAYALEGRPHALKQLCELTNGFQVIHYDDAEYFKLPPDLDQLLEMIEGWSQEPKHKKKTE
jgi:hypothetical protein